MPWVLGDLDLGDDVLEIGPGFGATTDVLREKFPRVTAVEIAPDLAEGLMTRFAGTNVEVIEGDGTKLTFEDGRFSGAACFSMLHHVPSAELQDELFAEACRVLRHGGVFVATDSVPNDGLREFHEGDTFVPVDPATVGDRLRGAGFEDVDVELNEWAWKAVARRA